MSPRGREFLSDSKRTRELFKRYIAGETAFTIEDYHLRIGKPFPKQIPPKRDSMWNKFKQWLFTKKD